MPKVFKWPIEKALPREFLAQLAGMPTARKVIVYPTSTLYGLGASIHSAEAIRELFALKSRPAGMPLTVMANPSQLKDLCKVPAIYRPFMESDDNRVTAILEARSNVPVNLVHNGTLAVRLPCSELTRSLVDRIGPLTSTSANIHGLPTPPDIDGLVATFGDRIFMYIDSGPIHGLPTSIIDFTGTHPKIIREGALSRAEMERAYERS